MPDWEEILGVWREGLSQRISRNPNWALLMALFTFAMAWLFSGVIGNNQISSSLYFAATFVAAFAVIAAYIIDKDHTDHGLGDKSTLYVLGLQSVILLFLSVEIIVVSLSLKGPIYTVVLITAYVIAITYGAVQAFTVKNHFMINVAIDMDYAFKTHDTGKAVGPLWPIIVIGVSAFFGLTALGASLIDPVTSVVGFVIGLPAVCFATFGICQIYILALSLLQGNLHE
jgi:hypothetical protein